MQTTRNPSDSAPRKPLRTITESQLQIILQECVYTWQSSFFTLLFDTGLRIGELCQLTCNDLWMLDAPINALECRAAIAKNHKSRIIPLTPRAVAAIQALHDEVWYSLSHNGCEPAFPSPTGRGRLLPRTAQRLCSRYGRKYLKIKLTPHMFRHSFATRLMTKCSIRVVQQLLGHSSLASTQIYTHPNNQDLQNAIDSLNS